MNRTGLDGRDSKPIWQRLDKMFGARTAAEHATHLVPFLEPHFHVLDVGCGLGSISMDLAELVPQGRVKGIDTNPTTTAHAEEGAKSKAIGNIEFSVGDVHDLSDIASGSFDVVHAHQVFLHLTNPVNALMEVRRVLKPGGILAIRDNAYIQVVPSDNWTQKSINWFQQFSRANGADPQGGLHSHTWVHQAGFSWENIQPSSASWGVWGLDSRKIFAEGTKNAAKQICEKAGYGTEAEIQQIDDQWEEWILKDEARILAMDGVVVAWK